MDDDSGDDVDVEEKVIVMPLNRPKHGLADSPHLHRSPSEIGDDDGPYGRVPGGGDMPQADADGVPETDVEDYSPPPKKSDPLPRPGEAYRACARFLNRLSSEQRLIHFVDKDCWADGFAYGDLRGLRWVKGDGPASGPVIELRFVEAVITIVRIEGQNIEDIHHWVHEGMLPWVWEQPTGYKPKNDHAMVVTRIRFYKVDRETDERSEVAKWK
jgi:hypothetical protein